MHENVHPSLQRRLLQTVTFEDHPDSTPPVFVMYNTFSNYLGDCLALFFKFLPKYFCKLGHIYFMALFTHAV